MLPYIAISFGILLTIAIAIEEGRRKAAEDALDDFANGDWPALPRSLLVHRAPFTAEGPHDHV